MERYSEYQVAQAKKRADQNNGTLDRIIPAITVEPDKQLEYFLQSKEGKRLKDNEIELIKKLIKDGEIKRQSVFPIDPDDYNNKDFTTSNFDEERGLPLLRL